MKVASVAQSSPSCCPQVNDFAKRFHVAGDDDDAAPNSDAAHAPEPGHDRTGGLGYYEFSFDEFDLTVPRTYDQGHRIQFSIAGINDALLEPGRFLRLAIKQMRYLGSGNKRFPKAWLDDNPRNGRYVHPQVLKERLPDSGGLDDTHTPPMAAAPCPWSELARARLLTLHRQETGDNIDTFLKMGFSEDAVSCASSHREQHIAECGHLPALWSAFNARIPGSTPMPIDMFLTEQSAVEMFEAMSMLIQSRYLVNVGVFTSDEKIETVVNKGEFFSIEQLNVPPFVIIDPESGDIFVLRERGGNVLSLIDDIVSKQLGRKVAEAFNAQSSSDADMGEPEIVLGLVPRETYETFGNINAHFRNLLALEILVHSLVELKLDKKFTNRKNHDRFAGMLSGALNQALQLSQLEEMYRGRCWWAVTRGELGHETEAMLQYNEQRGLSRDVLRSAWDYKLRQRISNKYIDQGEVSAKLVLDLLKDFHPTDAITFSINTTVTKRDIVGMIKTPMYHNGIEGSVVEARINALNSSYSNAFKGAPRLYSQKELDYMVTNVKGQTQRRKITARLLDGGSVFFLLDYMVSDDANKMNNAAESHASLCRVYLEESRPERSPGRVLVVEWLEGVFNNIYKLCAVPMLTYLSAYLRVQVEQREFSIENTFVIKGGNGPCAIIALYAANERMRRLVESRNQKHSKPYTLTEDKGKLYEVDLAYSLILNQAPSTPGHSNPAPQLSDRKRKRAPMS
jgi:hypothetical protein